MKFNKPPRQYNYNKEYRKAGLEFEFAGVNLDVVADIIAGLFGGHVEVEGRFVQRVKETKWGEFKLEYDSTFLKEKRYEKYLKDVGVDLEKLRFQKDMENIVASLAENLVPFEVVLPPIPINRLDEIERFREALQANKAEGTKVSFFNAFGFHINVEVPDFETETIVDYFKAFLLLQYWFLKKLEVDFTRHKISGYINDFPKEYLQKVLRVDYSPDLETFISDFKLFNPTRNRPLDMYPLFAHIKGRENVIHGLKEKHLVKARPAFHYRLPDCRIDDPGWRLHHDWNFWVKIEELAEDKEKMKSMIADFEDNFSTNILRFKTRWVTRIDKEYMI